MTQIRYLLYNPELVKAARTLRSNSSTSEILLWNQLKSKKFHGLDFHRQKPIGSCIVDFYCSQKKLVIEIDKGTYSEKIAKDRMRDVYLESLGLKVVRFLDRDVKTNMEGILKLLERIMEQ
jgi:very-short-patch-repair endonuclease